MTKKRITWYVYEAAVMHRRVYLGFVKAKTEKKAAEIVRRKFGDRALDVIRKKYIVDRDTGAMRGPKIPRSRRSSQ